MAMKTLLLNTVITALRLYVGSGLYGRIAKQVNNLLNAEMSGNQKMQIVLDFAVRELGLLSETLVRAIVEVTLLKIAQPA